MSTTTNSLAQLPSQSTTFDNWRAQVTAALRSKNFRRDADQFEQCGRDSRVLVCNANYSHLPQLTPFTCHKRFCPDCARREAARKLQRYIPAIYDALALDVPKGWSLKKLELTTPFSLHDTPEIVHEHIQQAFEWSEATLRQLVFEALKRLKRLSAAELRRGRADLRKQKIAWLTFLEFGEESQLVHFHILFFGPYLAKERITEVYRQVTGDVCEVNWIRKIAADQVEDELQEICKYVTKFQALEAVLVPTLLVALKGVRRVHAYGLFQGLKAAPKPCGCEVCGQVRKLVSVLDYLAICEALKFPIETEIVAAYESQLERLKSPEALLDLKPGNNVGEVAVDNNPVRPYIRKTANPNPFSQGFQYPMRQ